MPSESDFLKLQLYGSGDTSASFITFRNDVAGTAGSSNMGKIDTFASEASGSMSSNLERSLVSGSGKYSNITEQYNSDMTEFSTTGYPASAIINVYLDTSSSGSTKININSLGGKYLKKVSDSDISIDMASNDLQKNKRYLYEYDTTASGSWILIKAIPLDQVTTSASLNEIIISSGSSLISSGLLLSQLPLTSGCYVVAGLNSNLVNEWALSDGSATAIQLNSSASTIKVNISGWEPIVSNPTNLTLWYDNDTLKLSSGSLSLAEIIDAGFYNTIVNDIYGRVISASPLYLIDMHSSAAYKDIIVSSGSRLMASGIILAYPIYRDDIMTSDGTNWESTSALKNLMLNTGSGVDTPSGSMVGLYANANDGLLYYKTSGSKIIGPLQEKGSIPTFDDSSITSDLKSWNKFSTLLKSSASAGTIFTPIFTTYALPYSTTQSTGVGVLDINGDLHYIFHNSTTAQKLSMSTGIVSSYGLLKAGYFGGVLAPNGDIHLSPYDPLYTGKLGQKISVNGVVSTYNLIYSYFIHDYMGGVVAPNGDVHFIPHDSRIGQKIDVNGLVSTYALVFTQYTGGYAGGVLAPNGEIHFVPFSATVGEKIETNGTVSTYNLAYSLIEAYWGGVLALNGDVHFIPYHAKVGQKIAINGMISTYSLAYSSGQYCGGVLAPNGDIHFIPNYTEIGQKIDANGVVSTYALPYSYPVTFQSGILDINGNVHFMRFHETGGEDEDPLANIKIITMSGKPFDKPACISPFLNKL
jgi:hypothetical protein